MTTTTTQARLALPAALLLTALVPALASLSLQAPTQAHPAAATPARSGGFFAGRLINPATGNPVKGVTVKIFEINSDNLIAQDKSGPAGYYRIDGIPAVDDELDVRVNGSAVHYETGWVACNNHVVPTWDDACSHGLGRQPAIQIQHL